MTGAPEEIQEDFLKEVLVFQDRISAEELVRQEVQQRGTQVP